MHGHRSGLTIWAAVATLTGLSLVTLAAQFPTREPAADLVLRGGKVIALDPVSRVVQAIAVRDSHILAIGSDAEIQRVIGPKTRVIELHGRAVTPGFIDAHTHTEHTAEFLRFWVDVHSPPLPS